MPARVIRGEINASDSLARVSMPADLTFRALIVAADDWGRLDGRLPVLRGMLFPLRQEVTDRKLDGWLDELAAGPDAPIVRYVVDGRPFIALMGWEKHRGKAKRAASSKYPEPHPRRSADLPGILENPGDPPESRSRETREGDERGSAPPAPAASRPARARGDRRARETRVPERLGEADRARVVEWAERQTPPISQHALGYAWQVYLAKAKAKQYRYADHAQAFMNALGASGEAWALKGYEPPTTPGGSRYRDADSVLAEAKRKQQEDDARSRAREQEGEQVGKVIELALRQAAGGAA